MFPVLRGIAIVVLGLFFGLSVGLVLTSGRAVAPTETPPTPITETQKEPVLEQVPATSTKPVEVAPTPAVPVTVSEKPSILTPGTPEYEKSLKEALDALAQLGPQSSSTPVTLSVNDRVRAAVVNIFCTSQVGATVSSITGSGIVIDPKGVILTNAHVGQYFLLKNYPTPGALNCVIRAGSPAYPAYTAELLYLPPSWISANAQKIDDESPTGNGEHDYALIRVTGSANASVPLPASFTYLMPSFLEENAGTDVLIAGYAAGFLGGAEITKNLYASSSYGKVREYYTYGSNSADLFSLGGSVVAQQGSSGGAVANLDGRLVGVVVTSTTAPDTASRDLRALSLPYIARDFEHERGIGFAEFLSRDLAKEAAAFNVGTAPTLTQQLLNVLNQ